MTDNLHPMEAQHLPPFITPPDKTDVLLIEMLLRLQVLIIPVTSLVLSGGH